MWIENVKDGVLLHLWIQPGASKSEVAGLYGDPARLKIRIAAPPVEGAANEELLRFLKKKLKLQASALTIVRGASSRAKDVFCRGISETQVHKASPEFALLG